jgi:hypothetical protein
MQARSEFPFRWLCAKVSWVQCHSLMPESGENLDVPKEDTAVEESEGDLREPPDEV